MTHLRHVIVGASAAGIAAAEAIRTVDRDSSLTVVSAEPHEPYARIFLPHRLVEAFPAGRLAMRLPGLWERLGASALLGRAAVRLEAAEQRLLLDDGTRLSYDRLLVATGASPILPEVEGLELEGVSGLRTWDDALRIAGWLTGARRVLALGAGLVSLKALAALAGRELGLTVIASSPQVLAQLLDPAPAAAVQAGLVAQGVRVITGESLARLEGRGRVEAAVLTGGETVPCDVVLVGKGVRPNAGWLAGSGLEAERGVPVDEYCRTGLPGVYAAGDVAVAHDATRGGARINAMWPNAVAQGRVAGLNMAGQPAVYDGSLSLNIGGFFGVPVAAVGISRATGEGYQEHILSPEGHRYRKIVTHEGRIVGAMLTGDLRAAGPLQSLVRRRAPFADWQAALAQRRFTLGARLAPGRGQIGRQVR